MSGTLRSSVLGYFIFFWGFSALVTVSEDSHSLMGGSDVVTSLGFSPTRLGVTTWCCWGMVPRLGIILHLLYSVLGLGVPS